MLGGGGLRGRGASIVVSWSWEGRRGVWNRAERGTEALASGSHMPHLWTLSMSVLLLRFKRRYREVWPLTQRHTAEAFLRITPPERLNYLFPRSWG